MDDDFNFEPIPGLPEKLPLGEELLWQGRPNFLRLAWHSFGIIWITAYVFFAMISQAIQSILGLHEHAFLPVFSFYFLNWIGASSILSILAYLQMRSTIYTITNKRVVLRIGAALPITFNIPFKQIYSVGVRAYGKTGSIALALKGSNKISYLSCWPHTRPWYFARPEPSLIFLEDIDSVSQILQGAMNEEMSFSNAKQNEININNRILSSNIKKSVSIAQFTGFKKYNMRSLKEYN